MVRNVVDLGYLTANYTHFNEMINSSQVSQQNLSKNCETMDEDSSGTTDATTEFCLHDEQTKPLFVIVIGIYVQFWMSKAIKWRNVTSSSKDQSDSKKVSLIDEEAEFIHPSDLNARELARMREEARTFPLVRVFKTGLLLFQVISLLSIFILDILHFAKYVKANPDASGWTHYNCYAQVWSKRSVVKWILTL